MVEKEKAKALSCEARSSDVQIYRIVIVYL
jgi:hypothetical protein